MSLRTMFTDPPVDVAIEVATRHVCAVALEWAAGASARVRAHAIIPLPQRAVIPSLTAENVPQPSVVGDAIVRACEALGQRARRVALVVPDGVARISFVRLAEPPARRADLQPLLAFHVRKSSPFRDDETRLHFEPGVVTADGHEYVVTQVRHAVLGEYEHVCTAAGLQPGFVGLASFGLANALLASPQPPSHDWLLVRSEGGGVTLSLFRGPSLVFVRHRPADGDESLPDLVRQTAMYLQDRLGGGQFSQVVTSGLRSHEQAAIAERLPDGESRPPQVCGAELAGVGFVDRIVVPTEVGDHLVSGVGTLLGLHSVGRA